jgi:ATP citrate (pro-S)-lyase
MKMIDISQLRRNKSLKVLALGGHKPILQCMLDFDYLSGKDEPSLAGIITAGTKFIKLFFGTNEVLVPCYPTAQAAANSGLKVDLMFNINSGRRCYFSTIEFFDVFPDAIGGHTFAEDMPEQFAIDLYEKYQKQGKFLIGPAGVGLIIPTSLKLGAIGGTDQRQLSASQLFTPGNIAVLSASGGMSNEILRIIANQGKHTSFGLCFGGDRFPYTTPEEAFLAAEHDEQTKAIVYYGELGGNDEYLLVDLIKSGKVTKPIVAYIAGVVGESFDQPVQFGHAKALARVADETASAKRSALAKVGVSVAESIEQFVDLIKSLEIAKTESIEVTPIPSRQPSMFSSTISTEKPDGYAFVGKTLAEWASEGDFIKQITSGILGHEPKSDVTVDFMRTVFQLSIDHGPQVSGALNTIVTARAGKNLVDSLTAGLLTIGPRFGGAVNGAAAEWHKGVSEQLNPKAHVEGYAKARKFIMGIGHKKYRLGLDDPRTESIRLFIDKLESHPHYDYAKSIEKITTEKKGNLILNIDGHIAAIGLDVLASEEGYNDTQLQQLIDIDFFNALFVIPRSIGFISHYLDQKRLDEGLFRLPDDAVSLS